MQLVYDIIHTAKGSSLNSIFGQSDTCTPLAHGQYEASQRQIRYISRASSETIRPGGGEIVLVGGKSKSQRHWRSGTRSDFMRALSYKLVNIWL